MPLPSAIFKEIERDALAVDPPDDMPLSPAHERKRYTGGVAAHRIHERRDDRPRLSEHGVDAAHEQGWNHQVIERQLAHAERNAVSAAYNFAEHLPERRKMMQAWADYLDGLKTSADVIPLFKRGSSIVRKTKSRLRVSKSRLA